MNRLRDYETLLAAIVTIAIVLTLSILQAKGIIEWTLGRLIFTGFVSLTLFLCFIWAITGADPFDLPVWKQEGFDLLGTLLVLYIWNFLFLAAIKLIDWAWGWVFVVGIVAPILIFRSVGIWMKLNQRRKSQPTGEQKEDPNNQEQDE